jgi:tagatose-6-phosphate ketose/aldose isomerase
MRDKEGLDPGHSVEAWLGRLAEGSAVAPFLQRSWGEQLALGYGHTLREIAQQPVTWVETASRVTGHAAAIDALLTESGVRDGRGGLVLTGSGSSLYAAECLAPALQRGLRVPVTAVSAGQILTHPDSSVPPAGPFGVVSFARSGNSPESVAVLDLLRKEPRACHLILTCNREGALVTQHGSAPRVRTLLLDEKTHDQSLVMTSSFTNMVVAGWALGPPVEPASYAERVAAVARAAVSVLRDRAEGVAAVARRGFSSVVYLGAACRLGSAREAGLKMLEMTDGRVWTMADSYLGLRHGPMSAIRGDTVVVAFLSSNPLVRAYEADLLRELERKKLGAGRVVVGASVPPGLAARPADLVVDVAEAGALTDPEMVLVDVVVGQLLAFFRCLGAGLRPDSPSAGGVINRVVERFDIHVRR